MPERYNPKPFTGLDVFRECLPEQHAWVDAGTPFKNSSGEVVQFQECLEEGCDARRTVLAATPTRKKRD